MFSTLYNSLLNTQNTARADSYFILKDFKAYAEVQKKAEAAYWDEIWKLDKVVLPKGSVVTDKKAVKK